MIAALLLTAVCSRAQTFGEWFDGRNLRLDYIFAGNSNEQHIFFEQACTTTQWAGRRNNLAENPLLCNGRLTMTDHATGKVLYAHVFSTLFQEWVATEEAKRLKRAFQTSYNVPMPRQQADVTVTICDFHGQPTAKLTHTIDPHDILIRQLAPNGIPFHYVWQGGSVEQAVDVAIVAEGYTKEQMPKFNTDCQRVVDALFAREPFSSLKSRFNVVAVETISDAEGPSIPRQHRWNNTPAMTHYDTFYSERYLTTQHMHRLYDLLSGVPFEHIIVLVNSSTYGGGGIFNQLLVTTSDHPTFSEVLVHEFGHSYAGLADEYDYGENSENIYPADIEPWEPNLTTLYDFETKWADLLPAGTAIPTPLEELPDYRRLTTDAQRKQLNDATQRVGVFEGGGYQAHGVYRPAQVCRMRINQVADFCPVCTRAIRRITDYYIGR